jgi:predicted RNase H-like nuclease (RuvC/YqgF family)
MREEAKALKEIIATRKETIEELRKSFNAAIQRAECNRSFADWNEKKANEIQLEIEELWAANVKDKQRILSLQN